MNGTGLLRHDPQVALLTFSTSLRAAARRNLRSQQGFSSGPSPSEDRGIAAHGTFDKNLQFILWAFSKASVPPIFHHSLLDQTMRYPQVLKVFAGSLLRTTIAVEDLSLQSADGPASLPVWPLLHPTARPNVFQ